MRRARRRHVARGAARVERAVDLRPHRLGLGRRRVEQRAAVAVSAAASGCSGIESWRAGHRQRHRAPGKIDDAIGMARRHRHRVAVGADDVAVPRARRQVLLVRADRRLGRQRLAVRAQRRRRIVGRRVAVAGRASQRFHVDLPVDMQRPVLPDRRLRRRVEAGDDSVVAGRAGYILRMRRRRRRHVARGAARVERAVDLRPHRLGLGRRGVKKRAAVAVSAAASGCSVIKSWRAGHGRGDAAPGKVDDAILVLRHQRDDVTIGALHVAVPQALGQVLLVRADRRLLRVNLAAGADRRRWIAVGQSAVAAVTAVHRLKAAIHVGRWRVWPGYVRRVFGRNVCARRIDVRQLGVDDGIDKLRGRVRRLAAARGDQHPQQHEAAVRRVRARHGLRHGGSLGSTARQERGAAWSR